MTKQTDPLAAAKRDLLSKQDVVRARGVRLVEEIAKGDDPRAIYIIANWRLHGAFGYEKDLTIAREMLEKASRSLVPEACYDLAAFIEECGEGKSKKREAFAYYLLAAVLGDKDAIGEVARCLYWGNGVYKNEPVAELLQDVLEGKARRLP